MTHGFQQQDTSLDFNVPKSAPTPQHGQKAGTAPPIRVPRNVQPGRPQPTGALDASFDLSDA